MTASFVAGIAKLISGANPRWSGSEPSSRQRIYFANHTSNLDGIVLWGVLPPDIRKVTRPVAAHDYWTSSKLRQSLASTVFHSILIERKKVTASNNPIDQILEGMGKQYSIIIFPEGGRNAGPDPAPFKSGLHHLAKKRPDVELIPVYIDNMNRILPKGEVLPVPLLTSVTFGPPLAFIESESKMDFLVRARDAVLQLRTV
jgi:1-acyl-sn-glycerol-3-phosphate acyltransferase